MKLLITIFSILFVTVSNAQSIEGVIVDTDGEYIPSVKLINRTSGAFKLAGLDGEFQIKANVNDTIYFYARGFDTTTLIVSAKNLGARSLKVKLLNSVQEISEAHVIRNRLAEFDVGYLPPISGVQITTGTNSVIELSKLNGAKSTANPREIFAKVPGLNIWESDGSGIQIGIGGRGLSPNRAANFNTRQNGYDISADALGYPESYYTPPIEALKSIQIIRGSASLQFGTQFGGLLNFMIKDPPANTPLEFTTRNTAGTYGY
ncbi:MAG: Fe(3+) dicitrate transport protein, partial [Crocinitomicaceae bacterium]